MKKIIICSVILIFLVGAHHVSAQFRTDSNSVTTKVGNPINLPSGPRPTAPPCPNNDCRQAVLDKFGITIKTSLPSEYALYAWEKLWDVSNTNFDELVKGTYVDRDDGGSYRSGDTIYLRGTYTRDFFYIIFIHEMGHVINDLNDSTSFRTKHNNIWDQVGGLTGYGRSACTYSNPSSVEMKEENYADLIAYYLNPEAADQTTTCSSGEVVFSNGANREYFELGKQILGNY